jgi:hypothetical protein
MNRARPSKLVLRAETCNKCNSVNCVWRAWRQCLPSCFMDPVLRIQHAPCSVARPVHCIRPVHNGPVSTVSLLRIVSNGGSSVHYQAYVLPASNEASNEASQTLDSSVVIQGFRLKSTINCFVWARFTVDERLFC